MSERVSLSQPQHQFIDAVDQRLRQLSQELLAPTPYLLEVPHGGFHYSHQASDWRRSCPFGTNEEQLQYLTFRPEFDKDTVLQAKGDWDDGKGNITNTTEKPSGLNTPLPGQLAKKKITLSDYKNKAAGQASVSAVMPKKTNEESKPSLKASDPESLSPPQSKAQPKLQHHGVKRSVEQLVGSLDLKQHATHHSPPTKKARLPSHTTPEAQPAERTSPAVEKPTLWDLPPMLSPTLPPGIEEELARMPNEGVLSGQKKVISLARPTAEKKLPPSALTSKEGSRTVKKITKEAKQNPDEAEKGVATPKDLKSKLALEKNTKPTTNGLISHTIINGAINSKSSMHDLIVEGKKSTLSPPASISTTPKSERKRLIVKLKIPKPIRKNIIRILQMQQPRPSQRLGRGTFKSDRKDGASDVSRGKDLRRGTSQESEHQAPKSDQIKTKNTPTINSKKSKVPEDNSNVPRSGEKRKRQDDQDSTPDPSSKRQKHPGGLDPSQKPHTPIRPSMRSPLGSQSNSAHKSQLSTPMREMKGTAMHRIGSSEGDVKTPLGTARDGTPANGTTDRVNRDGRSSSNTSGDLLGSRNEEIAAWKSEKKRYEMLGRTLKHEAKAALLNDSKSEFKIDTPSLRYGAAIAFETILAFFLAFTMGDEINRLSRLPNDITAWRTLVPFVRYVERVTIIYRPLFGLTQQLEAVCRDTISLFDAERLERDATIGGLVDDQRPSTANSSENHPSPMALEKSKPDPAASEKSKADPAVELAENLRQAQLKWQLGHTECSVRELQRSFPETWNKSAELPGPGKGKEKLSAKNYGNGTYYLPLGPSTSTIEGARVGWQMLGEWCKKNEVKWEGKLGL